MQIFETLFIQNCLLTLVLGYYNIKYLIIRDPSRKHCHLQIMCGETNTEN